VLWAAASAWGETATAFTTLEESPLLEPSPTAVSVGALWAAVRALPPLRADDRVLLLNSLGTARGVAEAACALAAGASAWVASAEERASDWALRDLCERLVPTVVLGPAPLLGALARLCAPSDALRLVVSAGPGLHAAWLAQVARWAPSAEQRAIWGPASAAGVATGRRLLSAVDTEVLGAPLRGRRVRVVGRRGELLPIGVIGEVHVGGLSGELVPSGVRASWRPHGVLSAARRPAGWINVDGRIADPRVLASLIEALPGVREAVVDAPEAAPGEPVVVAWVALEPGVELSPDQLRAALPDSVPPDFRPSIVVELPALPRDSSGAIERFSLPTPFLRPGVDGDAALHPGTETLVAAVYAEVLGLRRVGPHDGFIELGGNSLLAMRALSEIERRLGWRPSPRVLFFQTVRQLAQRADAAASRTQGAP
jgi:acyl-CoA synthetase (AMP-forming)/AMP-acid ligase II